MGPLHSTPHQTLETSLRQELLTGERVLWSASPIASRLKSVFWLWLFAIPWTVFTLFWETMALLPWSASTKTPAGITWTFGIFMPLFGLPFIAIGLWMMWQPIRTMKQAKLTLYALTDKRLLKLVDGKKRTRQSVLLNQIGPISRRETSDGIGDLQIETHSRVDSDGDRITEKFSLLGIPGVARVERLILEHTKT